MANRILWSIVTLLSFSVFMTPTLVEGFNVSALAFEEAEGDPAHGTPRRFQSSDLGKAAAFRATSPSRSCVFQECAQLKVREYPRNGIVPLIDILLNGHPARKPLGQACYCRVLICPCMWKGQVPNWELEGEFSMMDEPAGLATSCDPNAHCAPAPPCPGKCPPPEANPFSKCVCYAPRACACAKREVVETEMEHKIEAAWEIVHG